MSRIIIQIVVFLLLLPFSVNAKAADTYTRCIVVGADNQIYLTDSETCQVWCLDKAGKVQVKWGGKGTGNGLFQYISGIAVDSKGIVYVCNSVPNIIQKFNSTGRYIEAWNIDAGEMNGSAPMDIGPGITIKMNETVPMNIASGITIDKKGDVYVANVGQESIKIFTADGRLLRTMGKRGFKNGQFSVPSSLSVDIQGNVYMSDVAREDIQKLSISGKYINRYVCKTKIPKQECRPFSVVVDAKNNIYVLASIETISIREPGYIQVSNRVGCMVQKFDVNGVLRSKWMVDINCESLALDSAGILYGVGLKDNKLVVWKFDKNGRTTTEISVAR